MIATITAIIVGLFWILVGCVVGDLLYRGLRAVRNHFIPKPQLADDAD